jgi:prepilin-type N-terminal cleavage/methylation domain-containing protein/prepilin-type processing-associated H-X9-DG protein
MNINHLKLWHWMITGAIVGLLLGYVRTLPDTARDPVMRRPITAAQFAAGLTRKDGGEPRIRNVVIHPARGGENFVTGEVLDYYGYRTFAFFADQPFVAGDVHASSVLEFARQAAARDSSLAFTYPWHEASWFIVASRGAGGLIVIGFLWPMLLNLLRGAPLLGERRQREEYDLNRFQSEPAGQSESAPAKTDTLERLHQLEDELEQKLKDSAADRPADRPSVEADAPPVQLTGGPLESAVAAAVEEPKDYRGEFYPVAKPHVPSGSHSGFALVELLVVIGIVAVLLSLLLPVLTRARQYASATACSNNLRQISIALQTYLNENRTTTFWRGENLNVDGMDWYAYGGRETGNANHGQGDYFNLVLPRPLNKYVSNKLQVFRCPNDDAAPWTFDTDYTIWTAPSQFDWVGNSYQFNANGYPLRPPPRHDGGLDGIRFSSITDTSRTIVFFDACLYYGFDWHYAHKANVAFADGHVDFLPLPPENEQFKWNP